MIMRTDGFANLLDPAIRDVFYDYYAEVPTEHEEWINMKPIDRAYVDDTKVSDLGGVPEKAEGGSVTFEDLVGDTTKRHTPRSYAKGFVVTREMWDDDLHDVMRQATSLLKKSVRYTFEVEAYRPLNYATDTSARYLGLDAKPLLSTTHAYTNGGGTTWANKPSTDVDISYTAVQTAMLHFGALQTDKGIPAYLNPAFCITSNQNQFNAAEIFLNGPMQYGTADNSKNFVVAGPNNNSISKVIFSRFFDDTDQWMILANKNEHNIQLGVRTAPEFETMDDFYTGNVLVRTYFRLYSGFTVPHGTYGSTGA